MSEVLELIYEFFHEAASSDKILLLLLGLFGTVLTAYIAQTKALRQAEAERDQAVAAKEKAQAELKLALDHLVAAEKRVSDTVAQLQAAVADVKDLREEANQLRQINEDLRRDKESAEETAQQVRRTMERLGRQLAPAGPVVPTTLEEVQAFVLDLLRQFQQINRNVDLVRECRSVWSLPRGSTPRPPQTTPKVICIANLKGGVGKTTITANLAGTLAKNHRVAVVDLDWQTSLSRLCLTLQQYRDDFTQSWGASTISSVLSNYCNPDVPSAWQVHRTYRHNRCNFDVIPTSQAMGLHEDLALINWILGDAKSDARFIIGNAIRERATDYDFILLDCPPRFTVSMTGALSIADLVRIPTLPDSVSLDGVKYFFSPSTRSILEQIWMDQRDGRPKFPKFMLVGNRVYGNASRIADAQRDLNDLAANVTSAEMPVMAAQSILTNLIAPYTDSSEQPLAELRLVVDRNSDVTTQYNELAREVLKVSSDVPTATNPPADPAILEAKL